MMIKEEMKKEIFNGYVLILFALLSGLIAMIEGNMENDPKKYYVGFGLVIFPMAIFIGNISERIFNWVKD